MVKKLVIMMVFGIQIVGMCFALVMIYLTFLYYKRNNYSTRSFLLWIAIWTGFLLAAFYPQSLYGIMEELAISRTVDLFVIGGFMFFTVVIFYLYTTIKALEGRMQTLVTKVAKERARKPARKRTLTAKKR